MIIYLDNNVIINIEENKLRLPQRQDVIYPFSYVHIEELLESGERLPQLKDLRLSTLSHISDDKYLVNDSPGQLIMMTRTPLQVFQDIANNPLIRYLRQVVKRDCAKLIYEDEVIKYFNIDKRRINNYTSAQLLKEHSDFIEQYITATDDGNRQASFNSFFNAMDMLGFWQDKLTPKSSLARQYDANHAYHATLCDYFVTDDKRTRNKANVLYIYYNYQTKAISTTQLLDLIKI